MTSDSEAQKVRIVRQRAKYPEEAAELAKARWIRVMCDYAAAGVWDEEGCATCPDVLPISNEVMTRIYSWQADYETLDPMDCPVDPDHFAQFVKEGFLIAIEMKRQLPDWTIIYHDDGRAEELGGKSQTNFKSSINRYRLWFEYEITDTVVQSGQKPCVSFDQLSTLRKFQN